MAKNRKHAWRGITHKWNTLPLVVLVALIGLGLHTISTRKDEPGGNASTQSHRTYRLKSEKSSFEPKTPAPYEFQIVDETSATLKNFDTVYEKQMHVIIVRKDLTSFQHIHPDFDAAAGSFRFSDLTFPTDGEYRVFADFTPSHSQKGHSGTKLPVTLHEDIKVGDMSRYHPLPLGNERLASNAEGFATGIVHMPGDSAGTGYQASTETRIPISINKDSQPYTKLQNYLGVLGHMIVLSENDLDFIHAHTLSASDSQQNGVIQFAVNFPKPVTYKLFLQTQAESKVITTDYVLTVSNSSSSDHQQNMNHGVH